MTIQKHKKGFTLIELLCVLALISIFTSFVIPIFNFSCLNIQKTNSELNYFTILSTIVEELETNKTKLLDKNSQINQSDSYNICFNNIDEAEEELHKLLETKYLFASQNTSNEKAYDCIIKISQVDVKSHNINTTPSALLFSVDVRISKANKSNLMYERSFVFDL